MASQRKNSRNNLGRGTRMDLIMLAICFIFFLCRKRPAGICTELTSKGEIRGYWPPQGLTWAGRQREKGKVEYHREDSTV